MSMKKPPQPIHVPGTTKGEELVLNKGREPGRGEKGSFRTARDSTSVSPAGKGPIDPRMPHMPPS